MQQSVIAHNGLLLRSIVCHCTQECEIFGNRLGGDNSVEGIAVMEREFLKNGWVLQLDWQNLDVTGNQLLSE
jgi:hypothetical protein